MEFADVAQAVAIAEIGPLAPYRMLICPAAMFTIAAGIKRRGNVARPARQQVRVSALNHFEPADARADKHSDPVANLRRNLQSRLHNRLLSSGKRVVGKAPHLARFLLVYKIQRVKVLHLGGKGDRKASGIEPLDRGHATGAVKKLPPDFGSGVAHTAHQPQAGVDFFSCIACGA